MPAQPIAMPICELCDRLTIAKLKLMRLPENEIDKTLLQKQIDYYETGLDDNVQELKKMISDLFEINGKMWDAEYAIRKGLDEDLGLEEIGKRALIIRDLNRERVAIKNQITRLAQQPEFLDCKMNHASS
jgi:hypothetical protein